MKIKIILTILYIFFISIIAKAQHMDMMMMDHSAASATSSMPKHDFSYKRQVSFFKKRMNSLVSWVVT